MDTKQKIILRSLLLTILIFTVGIIVNHLLDYVRIGAIVDVMQEHELDRDAYHVEYLFANTFEENTCEAMTTRIRRLKEEMRKVGEDLSTYSRFSFFKRKDYDYLKRRYFLLQLQFLTLVQRINAECANPYLPIIFFYQIDDEESERQGFMLQDVSRTFESQAIVISLDWEYEDEPLVSALVDAYNVTDAPTIIIGDKKITGLTYTGQLNTTVIRTLREPDPYSPDKWEFTINAAGIDKQRLIVQLEHIRENTTDAWTRADATLIQGRISSNESMICSSLTHYDHADHETAEERALYFELAAAIKCGRNKHAFLQEAAAAWRETGNTFRADLDEALSTGHLPPLTFDTNATQANATVISGYRTPITPTTINSSNVTIGNTTFIFQKNSTLLTQVDRVHRDWLGGQLQNPFNAPLLVTFSERLTYNERELRADIGWHEGGRTRDFARHGFNYTTGTGTLVAEQDGRWYASDENGVFRFEVPQDKLHYPTTYFLHERIAVIMDTHGVNMLVEQAIRKNADFVLSDCDHPGKVYAAKYLRDKNIPVICYPDKYVYTAIGHNLELVGSPPIEFTNTSAIVGNRPITITTEDRVLAVNATASPYALWYYQTPTSYFQQFPKLNVRHYTITDFNQQDKIVEHARAINATIIATRVFNSHDYHALKTWLDENPARKTILFHTASYPYGQKILNEYPNQTSFDDPNPQ